MSERLKIIKKAVRLKSLQRSHIKGKQCVERQFKTHHAQIIARWSKVRSSPPPSGQIRNASGQLLRRNNCEKLINLTDRRENFNAPVNSNKKLPCDYWLSKCNFAICGGTPRVKSRFSFITCRLLTINFVRKWSIVLGAKNVCHC